VISTVVTLAVLVVVFAGIFPKVADYSQAWASIQQMPSAYVVALVVATVGNLAVYVWPLQAALPGPGFVVRQTSFAISNAVPAGGAVGLGLQYGMLDSYGVGAGAAASARHRGRGRRLRHRAAQRGRRPRGRAAGGPAGQPARAAPAARPDGRPDREGPGLPFQRGRRHADTLGAGDGVDPAAAAHLLGDPGPGPARPGGRDRQRDGDLVWRAATYIPQVLLGVLTFLWWRVTATRRNRRVSDRGPNG
jgi:hypothetical protein